MLSQPNIIPLVLTESTTNDGNKLSYILTVTPPKGYKFAIENSILINEQRLMTENFVFGPDFQRHKYYKKDVIFEQPLQKEGQSDQEYIAHVHDLSQLFDLYKDAADHEEDWDASQFNHFHCYRAELHEINGYLDKALLDYDLAIEGAGELPDSFFGKGRVLLYTGETEAALHQFETTLEVAESHFRDGALYYKKIKKAIKRFLAKNPQSDSRSKLQKWVFSTKQSSLVKKRKKLTITTP